MATSNQCLLRIRPSIWLCCLMALWLSLSACSVGPEYVRPDAREAGDWLDVEDPSINMIQEDFSTWWSVFNDEVLNQLVAQAYKQNLSLQVAGVRILESRAQLGIAIGNRYPQLQQIAGGLTYAELSDHSANSRAADLTYGELDVGFDAAWELDFWGKFSRAIQAQVGNLEASIADYDDVLVALTAEVARTYVLIRTLEERIAIAQENIEIQERSLSIAEARYKGGEVSELDVSQATALLRDTQALIPRLRIGLRQAQNSLAILLGALPGDIDALLMVSQPIPEVPAKVAVGIPAQLLRRRPDIRRTERLLATQSALIGVAQADLYPHFSLFGSIGLRSSDSSITRAGGSSYSDLFDAKAIEFFAGPSLTWDVLSYGRIKNRVRVEDARFQQLLVDYQDTILRATGEVEDALTGFLRTKEEVGFLTGSVVAAKRSVDLALIQYREGLVDYQRVLDTSRFLTQQQDLLIERTGDVAINLTAMYKALGGGWQIRIGQEFVPSQTKAEMQERTDWGRLLEKEKLETVPAENAGTGWEAPDW